MPKQVMEIGKEYAGDHLRVVVVVRQLVDQMVLALPGNHAWLGLQVDAFSSGTDASYGWAVSYHAHRIELDQAKQIAHILGRIHRHLDKTADSGGAPESFGQYVLRVAASLGITLFVVKATEWNEEDQWLDAQGACSKINCVLYDYHVEAAKQVP